MIRERRCTTGERPAADPRGQAVPSRSLAPGATASALADLRISPPALRETQLEAGGLDIEPNGAPRLLVAPSLPEAAPIGSRVARAASASCLCAHSGFEDSCPFSRMSVMFTVEREVDRVLLLLRNKIRERGFTQQEVQAKLGWGRSYISQLLMKQKALRLEQLLLILATIGVECRDFFAELYPPLPQPEVPVRYVDAYASARGETPSRAAPAGAGAGDALSDVRDCSELRAVLRAVVGVLVDKGLVTLEEMLTAIRAADPLDRDAPFRIVRSTHRRAKGAKW